MTRFAFFLPLSPLSVMDLNVKGYVFSMQHAIPLMGEGGNIVNIGSVVAYSPFAEYSIYCASKAAVSQLTRVAAKEVKGRKSHVEVSA